MKKTLCLVMAMLLLILCVGGTALASTYSDIKQSVVRVYVSETVSIVDAETYQVYQEQTSGGFGTAFAVGTPGEPVQFFVTNEHVATEDTSYKTVVNVSNSSGTTQRTVYVITDYTYHLIFSDTTTMVRAEFAGASDRADVAALMLMQPTTERKAAVLRPFETLNPTETLWACGFPYVAEYENEGQYYSGYDQMMLTKGEAGTVKNHAITGDGELIIHTIPTTGGNSGSPVVDEKGYVVGVHSHAYLDDGEHSAFKGAVSSNELIRFLNRENIPYTTVDDLGNPLLPAAAAVLAVMLIVVVVLLVMQKKGGSGSKKPSSKPSRPTSKTYTLVGTVGVHAGKSYTITSEAVQLGRNTVKCKIAYPADAGGVSALHCELKAVSGGVQVTDLGSSYGTWVDKVKLQANTPVIMQPEQTLSLGSKQQRFTLHK